MLEACRACGVGRLVMASSPTTVLDGTSVLGATEAQLHAPRTFLHEYARTKAMGTEAVLTASCDELLTCAIAPHQVYGVRDRLFLPSFAAKARLLRIFGDGNNIISFTAADNCAHAMVLAAAALAEQGSSGPASGSFYIVTDGCAQLFWDAIDTVRRPSGRPMSPKRSHPPNLHRRSRVTRSLLSFAARDRLRASPAAISVLLSVLQD